MHRISMIVFMLLMTAAPVLSAESNVDESGAKELSGMSIVGNDEAPKSLYIVPWKSSDVGIETSMDMLLNKNDVPVDRDVFKRQLDFYEVSTNQRRGRTE